MRAWQVVWLMALCGCVSLLGAASLEQNFADDPARAGWQSFGDASLFRWNAMEQHLGVTWDSSRPNSYFYRRLPIPLSKRDDFGLAFDLTLSEVQVGVTPGRPFTFQIALGFLKVADAIQNDFLRGSGINPVTGPRNLIEFDYFPDSGFGATISPTLISSNNQFASSFSFPLELDPGARFHVEMRYTAVDGTLRTTVARDGAPFGPVKSTTLPASFSDFAVDAVSIHSFNDAGADGSILARGLVDNVLVDLPEPPVNWIAGRFAGRVWEVISLTRTNWLYTLEVSRDLRQWTAAAAPVAGTGATLHLTEEPAGDESGGLAEGARFYRLRAERP